MTELTSKRRKALPDSKFALPDERAYPVDTRARAANAKARATQQYEKGNLSAEDRAKINRKANGILNAGKNAPQKKRRLGMLYQ